MQNQNFHLQEHLHATFPYIHKKFGKGVYKESPEFTTPTVTTTDVRMQNINWRKFPLDYISKCIFFKNGMVVDPSRRKESGESRVSR